MHWHYVETVQPYAFGVAYSDDGKDLKEAALQYLRWYLKACLEATYKKGEIGNVENY